jgi:tRNA pseudouridine55 synthase
MSTAKKPDTGRDSAAGLDGVLVIDKPPGLSSMAAVARIRRKAGGARTGHAGTLDPLATGVLVIAIGKATRIITQLMDTDKRYRTTIDLAAFTSTDDREGEREEVIVEAPPTRGQIEDALREFTGRIMQRPPAYSAMKVGGQRAYKLARRGKAVQLAPREVVIHHIATVSYTWPMLEIDVHCAKGTYIRSLARDIGAALGTGGHCASLVRTAVGPFTIEQALALDDAPDPLKPPDLIPIDEALKRVADHAGRSKAC